MAEKSSFSHTCNRLSQFLKERRGFGDLGLGIMPCNNSEGSLVTTMNLFPIDDKVSDVSPTRNIIAPQNLRSKELFPQQVGSVPKEDVQKSVNKTAAVEPQSAQMTIFYNGQVIVLDDFPADKAKEIMHLASNSSFPSVPVKGRSTFTPNMIKSPIEPNSSIVPTASANPSFAANSIQERVQTPRQPIASDLPIARRASLHRFLEKRKDRITAKAPYQTGIPSAADSSKPVDSKSWLGLAAQSHH